MDEVENIGAAGTRGSAAIDASIFRAYDIRGVLGKTLTPEVMSTLGQAIGTEALERGQEEIAVGRDGRLSGAELAAALREGLVAAGMSVVDVGMVPTPLLYFAVYHLGTGAGVMVTGSHNPGDYNGLKIVLGGETLAGEAIQQIRARVEAGSLRRGAGSVRARAVLQDYVARVADGVRVARPLRVVVDCGSGVAGVVAPALYRRLGCEVIELFCEVDGRFPHHHPDPSQPANLRALIAQVRAAGADLGLAFDGDGDRLGVVDEQGQIIWPDRQLMLFAREVLQRHPGAAIIYDVKCTGSLDRVIREAGGSGIMWKTGHSLIKKRMAETGALLAGEMSGHIFFREGWYGFDDALYAGARLLALLAQGEARASAVFGALPDAMSTPELHVQTGEGEHFRLMEALGRRVDELARGRFAGAQVSTLDGLRVDFADRWGLVRASNTTSCLVLRFEGDSAASLERVKEEFRGLLRELDADLDIRF